MLTRKLTREEQGQILNVLFGFFFVNVNEKMVVNIGYFMMKKVVNFTVVMRIVNLISQHLLVFFHIQYIGQRIKGIQIANMKCVKCWGFLKLNV